MVTLCSDASCFSLLPPDPYAARITALVKTYGTEQKFAMFWVQRSGENVVAAIAKIDGNVTVCHTEKTDFEELSEFICAIGFSTLTCEEECMKKLGIVPSKTSFTVKYKGETKVDKSGIIRTCDKRPLYDLLCSCGFELGDYNAFLADVCARLNKKTASFAAIEKENEIQACAFALFEGEKSVLLGAVATKASARGNGYASKLVTLLAQENSSKEVYLFCRNDELSNFYGKIGFEIVGRWAIKQNYE